MMNGSVYDHCWNVLMIWTRKERKVFTIHQHVCSRILFSGNAVVHYVCKLARLELRRWTCFVECHPGRWTMCQFLGIEFMNLWRPLTNCRNYLRKSRHLEVESRLPLASLVSPSEDQDLIDSSVYAIKPRDILSFAWQISKGMTYLSEIKVR